MYIKSNNQDEFLQILITLLNDAYHAFDISSLDKHKINIIKNLSPNSFLNAILLATPSYENPNNFEITQANLINFAIEQGATELFQNKN